MLEKSQGVIFSVFAVTLWKIMNISQSFHDSLLPILDYNQTFLVERSDHVYYRYCGVDIAVDVVVDMLVDISVDGWLTVI